LLLHLKEGQNTLLVTSALSSEGKSVVAANLALVFAEKRDGVLLVDGNLRNPHLHELFGTPNRIGFRDVLEGRCPARDAIIKVGGSLTLLPAGPAAADPEGVISDVTAPVAMRELKGSYDLLIVDSPSALACPDAELLSKYCTDVLLVLGAGQVSVPETRLVQERLQAAGARVLGSVFNSVPESEDHMYYSGGVQRALGTQADLPARNGDFIRIGSATSGIER
jgi:capsular exopolysaccharide synthesis family protein